MGALGKACHYWLKAVYRSGDTACHGRTSIWCQKLSCNQGGVGSCIVMLEGNTGTLVMEKWYDVRTQDVFDITTSIQIVLHYNQVRLLATHYPTQTIKSIHFQHAAIRITIRITRLCGDKPEFCHHHDDISTTLNKTLFELARRQMK